MATRAARSSASRSLKQRIIGGVVGGIAGDLVFGAMIGIMGMLPKVRGCWLPLPHVQQRHHRRPLRPRLRSLEPHLWQRRGFGIAIRGDLVGARSVDPHTAVVGDGRAIRRGLIPDEPDELDGTPDLRAHNRPGIRGIHTTTSGSLRRRGSKGYRCSLPRKFFGQRNYAAQSGAAAFGFSSRHGSGAARFDHPSDRQARISLAGLCSCLSGAFAFQSPVI